jgi:hypothetical protein
MILSNQKRCPDCGDSVYSASRHDFQDCTCGKTFVDGGMDYLRQSLYGEDLSILITEKHKEGLLAAITREDKNALGKLCQLAIYLRDEMGINIDERDKE